jgi:hypothetical protein
MDNKLFLIVEDNSSEPYTIIIKTNDKFFQVKMGGLDGIDFRQKLKSSLIKFVREQSKEFNGNENSVYMSQDTYLWLSIDDINLFKHLQKKLEIINRVEITDVIFNKSNNMIDEINHKFNYYLLENELNNDKEYKKRIKI